MRISVAEAKDQLVELARRAEAGDEVVLTQVGGADIRLVPEPPKPAQKRKLSGDEFLKFVAEIQKSAAKNALPGPSAARSADFLYDDETGLPK